MPYEGRGGGRGGGAYRGGGGGGGGGAYRGRRDNDQDPNGEQHRKLFIGGLSYDTDDRKLREHFEQYGEVIDCVVMKNPDNQRSRGFGFVTYKEVSQIDEAQKNRVHNIDGRDVETKRAMPREPGVTGPQQSVTKMFIGGVAQGTTEDQIRDVFAEFGNIETVDVVKDKVTGNVRGFCFVTFDDYDSVDKAVLKKRHDLNGKTVEVKKACPKDSSDSSRGGRGGGQRGGGRGSYGGGGGYSNGGGYGEQQYSGYGGGHGGYQSGGGGYGDFNQQWGQSGGGGLGTNYGGDYSGGAMKGGSYSNRSQGPYAGGYAGGSGGGGYRR